MKKLILLALFLLSAILIPNAMSSNMPNKPACDHATQPENTSCSDSGPSVASMSMFSSAGSGLGTTHTGTGTPCEDCGKYTTWTTKTHTKYACCNSNNCKAWYCDKGCSGGIHIPACPPHTVGNSIPTKSTEGSCIVSPDGSCFISRAVDILKYNCSKCGNSQEEEDPHISGITWDPDTGGNKAYCLRCNGNIG